MWPLAALTGFLNKKMYGRFAWPKKMAVPWALIEFLDLESGRLFEVGAYSKLAPY